MALSSSSGGARPGVTAWAGPGATMDAIERAWPGAGRKLFLGLAVALAAISLRLVVGTEVGRDQIVFSYPAVVVATLLFGAQAGAATAAACLLTAWYFVIPPAHSWAIRDTAAATTLAVDLFTSATLVGAVGAMRAAMQRYEALTAQLERRVRQRTDERDRLWERSPDLIATVGRAGTLRAANPAFAALLGGSGRVPTDLFAALDREDRVLVRGHLEGLQDGQPATAFEARLATPAGPAWIAWSAVRDGDQLYLVGRDVTAERECNEQLRQSQKMETIGQMTGGLAHDFANLLMPIGLSLDVIRRRHGDDPRTMATVDGALEATTRAQALVERLMAFARRQPSTPRRLDLAAHLRALQPLLVQSIGSRRFALRLADPLPAVAVDPSELDNALLNLVVNARDASPDGSTITLAARVVGEGVELALADQGAGMDAATLARACEPFFSTKPRGRGTGLGLAMVHNFTAAAGGRLGIDSRPGHGTTITLVLPAAPEPAPA